jgi:hypothetical protein
MVREPGNRPDSSTRKDGSGTTSEPAVSEQQQKVRIALAAGGVLLLAGACLVAFAMLRPAGKDAAEKTDAINLTAAGSSAGPVLEVVGTPAASASASAKA